MKVVKVIDKDITYCFHQCPYFSMDSNVMICEHLNAEDNGYIIQHPECDNGFPKKCPIVNKNFNIQKQKEVIQ
jgi:hypothetical protein